MLRAAAWRARRGRPVSAALLLLAAFTTVRGVYAVWTGDVVEENDHLVGTPAVRFGVILIALGLAMASHAIFAWPWVTRLVTWLHGLE